MSLIIAGERSGVGKTTVTLALLTFLSQQGDKVQSFKVGPDYIDPMFHRAITTRACRNLDPILTSVDYVRYCFGRYSQDVDYVVIEGVMGLFDGSNKQNDNIAIASTAHIAILLNLPILLVIDCSRLSGSVAAIVHGYNSWHPQVKIAGVILNRVGSDRHLQLLELALEHLNIPILGVLRRQNEITIPERHLGLIPQSEITSINKIFEHLATLARNNFNWQKLLPLLETKNNLMPQDNSLFKLKAIAKIPLRIAIAKDLAFNFYYQDNIDILEALGAEIIYWSPLEDSNLPEHIQGLIFGGGFPEVFAQQLTENQRVLGAIKRLIKSGIPTYAECGGLMYLSARIIDFNNQNWSMLGILATSAMMTKNLTLGYREATPIKKTFLVSTKQTVFGHEFHRSLLTNQPSQPIWKFSSYRDDFPSIYEGWQYNNVHASYLHLHFGGCVSLAENFLKAAKKFPI